MEAYLRLNPPARSQYRSPRRARLTGLTVVHTAESMLDLIGEDTGAEGVANFIRTRDTPGSYHDLVDGDSNIKVVRYSDEAYQDGTGSNPFALSISFACRAADWPTMPKTKRAALLRQGAIAFARQQAWLAKNGFPTTPLKRVTKAESDAGAAGFIAHGKRDPGRRSDPGVDFPWDEWYAACRAALGIETAPVATAPAATTSTTTPKGSPSMVIVLDPDGSRQWLCTDLTKKWLNGAESKIWRAAGVVFITTQATAAERGEMLRSLDEVPQAVV